MKHRCEPGYDADAEYPVFPYGGYGSAVIECYEDDEGRFWVSNSEYRTQVNYCPFCGRAAPVRVNWRPQCYLRGLTLLGIFNTVCGCLFNRVLVKAVSDTGEVVRWYWDAAADKYPPEKA